MGSAEKKIRETANPPTSPNTTIVTQAHHESRQSALYRFNVKASIELPFAIVAAHRGSLTFYASTVTSDQRLNFLQRSLSGVSLSRHRQCTVSGAIVDGFGRIASRQESVD